MVPLRIREGADRAQATPSEKDSSSEEPRTPTCIRDCLVALFLFTVDEVIVILTHRPQRFSDSEIQTEERGNNEVHFCTHVSPAVKPSHLRKESSSFQSHFVSKAI